MDASTGVPPPVVDYLKALNFSIKVQRMNGKFSLDTVDAVRLRSRLLVKDVRLRARHPLRKREPHCFLGSMQKLVYIMKEASRRFRNGSSPEIAGRRSMS